MKMTPPLRDTNPYLRDPVKRHEMVCLTVCSSTAIEGVRLSLKDIRDRKDGKGNAPAVVDDEDARRRQHHPRPLQAGVSAERRHGRECLVGTRQ